MGSPLDNLALFQNQDDIGIPDGREPVSNDKGCSPLHELIHSSGDLPLGPGIHRGSRFIQNKNQRIGNSRPGNGKKLPLSLGKAGSVGGNFR